MDTHENYKNLLTTMLVTLSVSAPLAWADWAQHVDNYMGLKAVITENDKQVQMDMTQECMLRMHEQMYKLTEVKNPPLCPVGRYV